MKYFGRLLSLAALLLTTSAYAAQTIPVPRLATAPIIDGDLSDWPADWHNVAVDVAMEDDKKNRTGALTTELQAVIVGDRLYIATRWPDASENRLYKPWKWRKNRYKRGKNQDDMFAIRFDMGGDFNTCMIAEVDYNVDVWLWSAARSDPNAYASDMWHKISISRIEDAAEYETDSGKIVYIKKGFDSGRSGYKNAKIKQRKKFQGDQLPSIDLSKALKGSVADVSAKGVWKEGVWSLEFSRQLNTGHSDDVVLEAIDSVRAQIAVFNQGFAEHKSVSAELIFRFD
ncbi:MAG: ethylbenzene dehydrogenase-related protein [Motiliproteus sp.]